MAIHYNTRLPDTSNIITGYDYTPKCIPGDGTFRSLINNAYNTIAPNIAVSNNFITFESSDPSEALIQNLNLNLYDQITAIVTVNCDSNKKGTIFGYYEGNNYCNSTTQITSDTPSVFDTTALTITDTTPTYTASTQITSDTPNVFDTTALTITDTTPTYTASTQITSDISINTTIITGTQFYADNPNRQMLFKLDRAGQAVYAIFKSDAGELISTGSYTPNIEKDIFVIIFEKNPHNKLSIYLNGSLLIEKTSTFNLDYFPIGTGMRLFANGVSTDTFDGSIKRFILYSKKISEKDIYNSFRI